MDMKDLAEKYNSLPEELKERAISYIMVPAANELLAEIKNRIVLDGKKTDTNQIGKYSGKAAYFGIEAFDKKGSFKAQSKGNKKTKVFDVSTKKGRQQNITNEYREPKTMYLAKGYKQLRNVQGKPTDKINLNYTGSTLFDYQLQAKQNEVLLGFVSERSSQIRKGQERKRGKIFYATEAEMKQYKENVITAANDLTLEIFRGD